MKSFTLYVLFVPFLLLSICNNGEIQLRAEDKVDEAGKVNEPEKVDELDEGDEVDDTASVVEDGIPEVSEIKETVFVDEKPTNTHISLLFTKPSFSQFTNNRELPAGKPVELLFGFINSANIDYIVEKMEASFRYPMDFNFYIQNFTTFQYNKRVPYERDATFFYTFVPSDSFASRTFGLAIGVTYKDDLGKQFYETVYNETITVVEIEEGLDGETFFLYIFLCAGVVLLLVIGQQFLYSVGKKRMGSSTNKKQSVNVEMGTKKINSIDYDFIPKHMLNHINKASKTNNKQKQSGPKQKKI